MQDEARIKTLEDGRKVKFIYLELPDDGAFITAQLAGNEVVYSVVLTNATNPLSREDVEGHFKANFQRSNATLFGKALIDPMRDNRACWLRKVHESNFFSTPKVIYNSRSRTSFLVWRYLQNMAVWRHGKEQNQSILPQRLGLSKQYVHVGKRKLCGRGQTCC
ncbi:MAG TPA: hypothetical protein VNO32_16615 [Candidatus Acidoferrum sp.]|jgi:hypothetical protein|nr:hypothetical protein [Candidatus Acidoferrum sp.]